MLRGNGNGFGGAYSTAGDRDRIPAQVGLLPEATFNSASALSNLQNGSVVWVQKLCLPRQSWPHLSFISEQSPIRFHDFVFC